MRADIERADRHHAVRTAAETWRRAGAIDEMTLDAVRSAYPDDRVRLGLGFRILAGVAALVGAGAFAALLGSLFAPGATAFAVGFAVVFAAATEIQIGRLRRAQAGAEYATAFLAATCASIACISWFEPSSRALTCLAIATVFAVAAWRWGYVVLAVLASTLILVAGALTDRGRGIWIVLGLASIPWKLWLARSERRPPAHRRCFEGVGWVLLIGAYVAINLYSVDHRWIEELGGAIHSPPGDWARAFAIAGTVLMPLLVLSLRARFRDRTFLALGTLFSAASLVTLRRYHPVGPYWLVLILAGGACFGLAAALRRWLDAGPGHERNGFTAEALFEGRRIAEAAQTAATLLAMTPGPRVVPGGGFEGGGGRSGGGGATGGA